MPRQSSRKKKQPLTTAVIIVSTADLHHCPGLQAFPYLKHWVDLKWWNLIKTINFIKIIADHNPGDLVYVCFALCSSGEQSDRDKAEIIHVVMATWRISLSSREYKGHVRDGGVWINNCSTQWKLESICWWNGSVQYLIHPFPPKKRKRKKNISECSRSLERLGKWEIGWRSNAGWRDDIFDICFRKSPV